MACFSLPWLESLLIWFVIACVLVGILKLIVPAILSWAGAPPGGSAAITALSYIVWGIIAIFVIVFIFQLVECALGGGLPALPLRR